MPWITHKEWAQLEGLPKSTATKLCSDNADYRSFPVMLDRRDVKMWTSRTYTVYYKPWDPARGQVFPRRISRKKWIESKQVMEVAA